MFWQTQTNSAVANLPFCSVIIVTYNSQKYLETCIQALRSQTAPPGAIIIIDNNSADTEYLSHYQDDPSIHIHYSKENLGFCKGNNMGIEIAPPHSKYILFLNPDAFLTPFFLEKAIHYMEQPSAINLGALSGLLLGYDIQQQKPTGKIDSSGIFQKWYGRWYDRDQGQPHEEKHSAQEQVPALCGALMFCRKQALDTVLLAPHTVMDPSFYMYKEDIDLSLRLRKKGWKLAFLPHLIAYHCRGWKADRSKVSRYLRLMSAKNEMHLHARLYSPYFFYSACKYLAVKLFNV